MKYFYLCSCTKYAIDLAPIFHACRHHVVNSIWSLKALDRHVISDEEIIEDADFGGKYDQFRSLEYS